MQSLAILFTGQNQLEVAVQEVTPPSSTQLLVRTRKTLISTGTECICLARNFASGTHWDNWVKYPFSPGYLNVGEVVEVGASVTGFQPGDRVACRAPHRQYFATEASRALHIPDGVSDEDAAWFGLAKITQNGVRKAEHRMGDVVVVIGLGLLGQLVVQYARVMGAREVIAVDMALSRLELARSHGATQVLNVGVAEAREAVAELTHGRLADVVYDVTGYPPVFSSALSLARRFGTVLLLGDAGTPAEQKLTSDVITRGVKIVGAHDSDAPSLANDHDYWTEAHMGKLFFTYLQRGQMRVHDLITHRFAPSQVGDAYHLLQTQRETAMGVLFDWTQL